MALENQIERLLDKIIFINEQIFHHISDDEIFDIHKKVAQRDIIINLISRLQNIMHETGEAMGQEIRQSIEAKLIIIDKDSQEIIRLLENMKEPLKGEISQTHKSKLGIKGYNLSSTK